MQLCHKRPSNQPGQPFSSQVLDKAQLPHVRDNRVLIYMQSSLRAASRPGTGVSGTGLMPVMMSVDSERVNLIV